MLITDGYCVYGTFFDDISDIAPRLKVGDCLTLGSFVPSLDSWSIPVRFPILWHVLDRQGNKVKLLSYFFFAHTGYWDIRDLLNNKYYYDCFNENERSVILTTEVRTQTYDSVIVTQDKLYVPAHEDIANIPEHLKVGRFITVEDSKDDTPTVVVGYCPYWLRDSEEGNENLVVRGYENSKLVIDSCSHNADEYGVRAIMWVDASKLNALRLP